MQPLLGVRHHESTNGARTRGGQAKAERMIKLLNEALATEIICILRYKRHYFMTAGISSRRAKAKFLQHVAEEQAHAVQLAERIVQLGGELDLPAAELLNRNHAEHVEGDSVEEMITADLIAERIAIDSYRDMIASIDADDPTTRQVMERILAQEEEHAEALADLLRDCAST
ncbi:MAG: ferritin-like domain-containing protein [Nitrospira sp.]|nr:ferritin-like domain-containing protein [Nitrospira sp.]